MATLQIDPTTGLPIIPKDWLTVTRDPDRWNEATGQMEQGQQRVVFTPEAQQLLGGAREGFNYGGNFDWQFGANDGGVQNAAWQDWTDPALQSVLQKTGERVGTRTAYDSTEGGYTPGEVLGQEEMYTNNGDMVQKALMAYAALAGGGLAGNYAMTGSMFDALAPGAMNLGGLAGGATGATGGTTGATGQGSFLNSLLGQSTGIEASAAAAQSAAPGFYSALTQTSLPAIGAATGVSSLLPQLPAAINPIFQTLADTPMPSPPTGGPPATTTPGSPQTPGDVVPKVADAAKSLMPTDLAGWAKLLGPLVGGGLLAYEASQQNGQQNPQDPFTRDWARGILSGPKASAPAMQGLLGKRYY